MAAGSETLLRFIRRLAVPVEPPEATDAALLGRYLSAKDEKAFTALVDRHGPLVYHVCQRVLGNAHDAEDAFQAVFLVLARKAATVRPRERLAAWLYGVARRVALKVRSARARRRSTAHLPAPPADPHPDPLAEISARELLLLIEEEIQRLPEGYRLPVILCGLEGRSLEEAARQLGWTPGSVKGRLERGRARLHARLRRRGLTLPAALAMVAVAQGRAEAGVLARLVTDTVREALAFGIGRATPATATAALAEETLKGMMLAKLKAAALLLVTGLLATALVISWAVARPRSTPPRADAGARATPAAPGEHRPAAVRGDLDAPVEVRGRVLDPQGHALAGARLYVGYSVRRLVPDRQVRQPAYPLRATSGPDGRFQFVFARSELEATWLDDSRPAVVALAGGYGPAWADIPEAAGHAELSLQLVEDLPVNGRLLNPQRRPAAGAKVFVLNVSSDSAEGVTRFLRGDLQAWSPRRWRGPFPEQPASVTTDADGRFRLTGLGRDRVVSLACVGPGLQDTFLTAVTRPPTETPGLRRVHRATFELVSAPEQPIRGTVRDQATGRPVAGVRVFALLDSPPTFTDANGRFAIHGCPKMPQGYAVMAQPRAGQPYFGAKVSVPDRPGLKPLTVDLDLVGGIPVSGRVTDQATGKPPRAAVVEYYPLFPNPHSSRVTSCFALAPSSVVIRPDGSYRLVVLPGPGVVCVAASPRDSYAVACVDERELADLFHDGRHHGGNQGLPTALGAERARILGINAYHALALIHPNENENMPALNLLVKPARTVHGTLVGPDGAPVRGVAVVGLTALSDEEVLEGASFTIRGLNPQRPRDLFFHHPGKELGRVVTVRGDEAEPLTVRLAPCGLVVGRLVDARGKPVPGVTVRLSGARGAEVTADTDADGRFRAALLSGAQYTLGVYSRRALLRHVDVIEVESGRSKDLGDLPLGD
jgi:RNA polymerase sigma factor (sigma-70 family)